MPLRWRYAPLGSLLIGVAFPLVSSVEFVDLARQKQRSEIGLNMSYALSRSCCS